MDMNKKICITRAIPDIGITMLRDKGYEVDVAPYIDPPTKEDIIASVKAQPYDAVITLPTDPIDSEVFDAVPTAKIFANYAVGFDNFNSKDAKDRGVTLTNAAGTSSYCVAEHAMALILALSTRLVEGDRYVKEGKYKGWSPSLLIGTDLNGKTVGIVGTGKIGEKVAEMAGHSFGMRVVYYDIVRNPSIEKNSGAEFIPSLEEVLKMSDIVTIHVPLNNATRHLINEDRLKLMKPTALIVNTARGPVIDEVALVKALQNKQIAGAGLDVFEFEPKLSSGLADLTNVILTPHIASARPSARNEMAVAAASNVISFIETGKAINPLL